MIKSQKNFIRAFILLGVIFPIILLAFFSYEKARYDMQKFIFAQRSSLAHLTAITLKERLERVKDLSVSLATRVKMRQLIAEGKWEEAIGSLESVLINFPVVNRIFLADPQGVLRADLPHLPGVQGMSFAYRDWYQGVMKSKKTYVSEIYTRTAKPSYNVVAFATPIRSEKGDFIGILVLQITLDTFLEWSKEVEAGPSSLVYFLDKTGKLATHPDLSSQGEIRKFTDEALIQKIQEGKNGVEISYDQIKREKKLLAYEAVPEYLWGVAIEQPVKEALATLNINLKYISSVYGFILLLSCLCGYLIIRNLSKGKQLENALRNSKEALMIKVQERTGQLQQANQELMQEISERKQAEGALIESEEKYRELVDEVNDGFFIVDKEGNFTFANKALAKMLGCKYPEELIGKKIQEFIANDFLEEVLNHFKNHIEGKKVSEIVNVKVIGRDGKERYIEVRPSPIYKEDKIIGSRGVIRDITERQNLEQQLRQSQKMEAIGRLAGGVAHDFNNLLTVMMGYSEIIYKRLPEEDPLHKEVEEIKKSASRAASLTRQLLAFSRQQILQPRVLNLNEIIVEMDKMLKRLIGENIDLLTRTDPDLGFVRVDTGQIGQMIMNLAVNAKDAMPQGGKLTLETSNAYLDEHYALTHPEVTPGKYVMIAVTDTGCGMKPEILSQIFDPFFTTKEPGKGTGLGLSTVYGIVKQSGGHIWVYSEEGKGSSFKIYFPRVKAEGQVEKGTTQIRTDSLKGSETILVVEDEKPIRELVQRILSENGYQIILAAHPDEALKLAEKKKGQIQLLITDMIMPGMTGLALAQRLEQSLGPIKVLYMSGYTEISVLHGGVLDPSTPFLQKPFPPQVLLKKVRKVLSTEVSSSQKV